LSSIKTGITTSALKGKLPAGACLIIIGTEGTPLQDAMADEDVPDSLEVEADKLANVLVLFGNSGRVAERKDEPLIPFGCEIIPKR
jgi:hypothetical protein